MSREEFQRYIAQHPPRNSDNTPTYEGFLVFLSQQIPDSSSSTQHPYTTLLEKIDEQQIQGGSIQSNSLSQSKINALALDEKPKVKEGVGFELGSPPESDGASSPPLLPDPKLVLELELLKRELKYKNLQIEHLESQNAYAKDMEKKTDLIMDYMRSKFPDDFP